MNKKYEKGITALTNSNQRLAKVNEFDGKRGEDINCHFIGQIK